MRKRPPIATLIGNAPKGSGGGCGWQAGHCRTGRYEDYPNGVWLVAERSTLTNELLVGALHERAVGAQHEVEDLGHERISDPGRERRLVQAVRIDGHVVVANLHATSDSRRP